MAKEVTRNIIEVIISIAFGGAGFFMFLLGVLAIPKWLQASLWFSSVISFSLILKEVRVIAFSFLFEMPLRITINVVRAVKDGVVTASHECGKRLKTINVERIDVMGPFQTNIFSMKIKLKPTSGIKARGKRFRAILVHGSARGENLFRVSNLRCTIGTMTWEQIKENFYTP